MTRFYQPDLSQDIDSPFIRDGADKLVRRSYWLDMDDRTLVMVMVNGIGTNLTNEEKKAHLMDLRREHLIDQVCVQEISRQRRDKRSICRSQRRWRRTCGALGAGELGQRSYFSLRRPFWFALRWRLFRYRFF